MNYHKMIHLLKYIQGNRWNIKIPEETLNCQYHFEQHRLILSGIRLHIYDTIQKNLVSFA